MTTQRQREAKKDNLLWTYMNKAITIQQFKAQMKDLGYCEWEINLYLDGDSDGPE